MPGMDGYEIARQIRKIESEMGSIPIITHYSNNYNGM